MKWIKKSFEGITMAGIGFLVTALVLLVTHWLNRREGTKGPAETKWWHALLIGLAQTLAPLPGVSRSGTTIAMGLALGLSRPWAVGFSLMMAVPAILGAVAKEVLDMVKTTQACRPPSTSSRPWPRPSWPVLSVMRPSPGWFELSDRGASGISLYT